MTQSLRQKLLSADVCGEHKGLAELGGAETKPFSYLAKV